MTEINYNHKRPYKKLSNSELHKIKNDIDIRLEHRSLAEAEISRRARFSWPVIVTAIATAITALFAAASFLKMFSPKEIIFPHVTLVQPAIPPSGKESNEKGNPATLVKPEKNIIHNSPPKKDLK